MPNPQPGTGSDWPSEAADLIVRVVGQVRAKTTGPVLTVARGIVYGLFAALLGGMAAVLVAIALVRVLDEVVVEEIAGSRETWAAHGSVGVLFVVAGSWMWSRRKRRAEG